MCTTVHCADWSIEIHHFLVTTTILSSSVPFHYCCLFFVFIVTGIVSVIRTYYVWLSVIYLSVLFFFVVFSRSWHIDRHVAVMLPFKYSWHGYCNLGYIPRGETASFLSKSYCGELNSTTYLCTTFSKDVPSTGNRTEANSVHSFYVQCVRHKS